MIVMVYDYKLVPWVIIFILHYIIIFKLRFIRAITLQLSKDQFKVVQLFSLIRATLPLKCNLILE